MTIQNAQPILSVEHATKVFGGLIANEDISFVAKEGESSAWWGRTARARPRCSIPSPARTG